MVLVFVGVVVREVVYLGLVSRVERGRAASGDAVELPQFALARALRLSAPNISTTTQ